MAYTGVADLVGRVLAARYRLLAPIGTGATGRVFLADDVRLRRRVAVKVLHEALAEDGGFLRRFRAEAQMAAGLHHPHVMAVYDWGEDEGVPFMVVELLKGGSLRALLDTGTRLSPSQVAHLGRQVAAALQYAHARGIVHRDIKPANLLFDEHGLVRVADFGMARALAEASWTEPTGSVIGTARYAAPEQAGGRNIDGRADLYSLTVVLVEAMTGVVPVLGDTALGTLLARAEHAIESPPELGPLGSVLTKAGRPRPEERFVDATAMGRALALAARALPTPDAFPIVGLGAGLEDLEPTRLGRMQTSATRPAGPNDATLGEAEFPLAVSVERAPRRRSAVPVGVAISIVAVLAVAATAAFAVGAGAGTNVPVPSIVGLDQATAAARATNSGLLMKVVERRTVDDPAGLLIAQHPGPGDYLGKGDQIEVVVSRGPPPVLLPTVAGKPVADAQAALEQAGFGVAIVRRNDETIAKDIALGTDPATPKAPRGSTVKLIVSDGPAPVPVPDVSGKSYADAAALLTAKRLQPIRQDVFSDTVAVGVAVGTNPAGGASAPRDSQVAVLISKGPEMITVPNEFGKSIDAASQELTNLGLKPQISGDPGGKIVKAQYPPAGTSVKKGTTVTLYV